MGKRPSLRLWRRYWTKKSTQKIFQNSLISAGRSAGCSTGLSKKQLTLRLDADIIVWFKARLPGGDGYQTSINNALREYVAKHGQE